MNPVGTIKEVEGWKCGGELGRKSQLLVIIAYALKEHHVIVLKAFFHSV